MTRKLAEDLGFKIRATIVNFSVVGTDPVLQLTGPIKGMPEALKRANMTFDDLSFIEINEAFSSVIHACCYDLGLDWNDERFNPWGGAIALGHPTGATGCRLIGSNVHQLEESGKEYAISSMCVGLGMALATIVKNEHPK
jgi:acetyl-CoA C-acetyltransferase